MSSGVVYFCHECGTALMPYSTSAWFYCRYCDKRRPKPTNPALIGRITVPA